MFSSYVLTENVDYTLAYRDNLLEGTAKCDISGIGDYTGQTTSEFYIENEGVTLINFSGNKVFMKSADSLSDMYLEFRDDEV